MTPKEYKELKLKRTKAMNYPPANEYNGIQMRSTWEVMYAAFLDKLLRKGMFKVWVYEPERFILGKDTSYLPDFRIITNDDKIIFVEMKGYLREEARVKFRTCYNLNRHLGFMMVKYQRKILTLMDFTPNINRDMVELLSSETYAMSVMG